jgi:hypothetical protein
MNCGISGCRKKRWNDGTAFLILQNKDALSENGKVVG